MATSKKPVAKKPAPKPKPPAKMPTRSKPSKKLAAYRKETQRSQIKVARVTAIRQDGGVNLMLGGARVFGVPAHESYNPRVVGDKVQVLQTRGQLTVLGKVGKFDNAVQPTIFPQQAFAYTYYRSPNDKRLFTNTEAGYYTVGRKGEYVKKNEADYWSQIAFGYWNGTSNDMNGPADTAKTIDLTMARWDWDDGYQGPVSLKLVGIKNDELPNGNEGSTGLLQQLTLTTKDIPFTLEPGEVKNITLPDDWRDNIGAATLTSETIRGFLVQPGNDAYGQVHMHTHCVLTNISGGLRIYSQT